jgi:hypothetical protein
LLFPLEDQEFGVQDQQFRQGLLALSAVVHALANRIGPLLGNMLDPFFALDHEGERPQGMTLAVGTVTGRLAATAVSKGERAGKGVGGHFETGEQLTLALPKTIGGRAGGKGSHLYLPVMIHADQKQSK